MRVIHFGWRFRKAADRLGVVPGSARGRAVGKTIATLVSDSDLPGPADTRTIMPPLTKEIFVRRVRDRNLWVWYRPDADRVLLVHISSEPPVPSDV